MLSVFRNTDETPMFEEVYRLGDVQLCYLKICSMNWPLILPMIRAEYIDEIINQLGST